MLHTCFSFCSFQTCVKEGAKVIATDIQLDKLKELEPLGKVRLTVPFALVVNSVKHPLR